MRSKLLQIHLIFLPPVSYRLQFSITRAYFVYNDMALYWPKLQFYLCVYVSFVCWYVAPPGE